MTLRPAIFRRLLLPLAVFALPALAAAPDPAARGAAVRVQDDLFLASNGAWLDSTPIPADKSEVYGADLPAIVNARVRTIVDDLRRQPQPAGSNARKLVDYFDSEMDTAAIDRAGLAPVRAQLAAIDAIATPAGLARWQGRVQGVLKTPLWLWGGFADFKDPGTNRVLVMQGGLGLPGRGYYLDKGAQVESARAAYLAYLATLARLAGERDPQGAALHVLALETRLAQAHVPAAEATNPARVQSLDAGGLGKAAPGLDWQAFLDGAGMAAGERLNLVHPPGAAAIARLLHELPLDDWKLYFRLRTLDAAAPLLPEPFRAAHFSFRGKALGGQRTRAPRAERALDSLSAALGDALGQLYMGRHFPPQDKARVERIVEEVRGAALEAVGQIAWMGPAARAEALAKVRGMRAKVGYPAAWRDYTGLDIRRGDALGNRDRARRHEWLRLAALSGTPVDRRLWAMSPLEPNAYYDPVLNEINLPAGHLQAPWFDARADDAANYGGIGTLVAHELSHAFDGIGSQFDSRGVQRDWWSEGDHAAFAAFSARLVARFDAHEVLPGARVNGKLTLPENIADLMGLQLAWRAYRNTQSAKLEGERRFFLAYARQWAVKRRDERTLQLLSSDPHAPAFLRANVPAMQLDGFHDAFGTQPGDRMFVPAADRLRAW